MTPQEILKHYWGHDQFRPTQLEIIESVLNGHDTLAILPTGGGKSICFQVPAMKMDGLCLVISPLIALMEDQVNKLLSNNIAAAALISGMKLQEQEEILSAAENDELKFLYVSPERLQAKKFIDLLSNLPISLIAVDEAHCISQWGYDFRPAYLNIAKIKENVDHVPVIALTASATGKVKQDIQDKLLMTAPKVYMTSFSRKNLSYRVEKSTDKISHVIKWAKKINGSGIVYCRTRRRTKEISDFLAGHDLQCDFYHAGLDQDIRKEKQERWINGSVPIMVCTNAFGMGIDKPDVRFVIHADVPDCLENYYQEAGRAGRDGQPASAILLYNDAELNDLQLQPAIKFPGIATLRKVYHALGNYLQVPVGTGQGKSYDFDFDSFLEKFKLNSNEVVYSLQALKQEEIITYVEKIFSPSSVQFISDRTRIEAFENTYTDLEAITKTLLRTYAGIFDGPVNINETQLAWILKRDIVSIKEQLYQLHQAGIIEYVPKNNKPQLTFLQERVRSEELEINHKNYQNRKKEYEERIHKTVGYIHSISCRSQFIGSYFGDKEITACGICENCQEEYYASKRELQVAALIEIIPQKLREEPKTMEWLIQETGADEKTFLTAIQFLKNEQKIKVFQEGRIGLK